MDQFLFRSRMPASADAVWDWHARPGALERLLPPWDGVRVTGRTGGLQDGTRITLSVPLGPGPLGLLRVRWVSRHRDCVRGRHFVDEQIEGPFKRWIHTHTMIPADQGSSFLEERIEFAAPGRAVGRLVAAHMLPARLAALFRYRHDTLRADLSDHARYGARPRLTVAITGARGLLGSALSAFLSTGGHRVVALVRRAPMSASEAQWDPERGLIDPERLPKLDAVIHLAGEAVASGRWTERRKAAIRHSRVVGTHNLASSVARLATPPSAFISASAIGFYGNRANEVTEEDSAGTGFLADVSREWEGAANPAMNAGIRVVHMRTGLVLSPAGGLLKVLTPLFQAGLGGKVGSGTQGISWIGIDDVVGAFHHALQTATLWGPVNATAPQPVTNAEFTDVLGRVLRRPTIVPVPAFGVRLALGEEMARETALSGARVLPQRLVASGYQFRYPSLEGALRHVLGRQSV